MMLSIAVVPIKCLRCLSPSQIIFEVADELDMVDRRRILISALVTFRLSVAPIRLPFANIIMQEGPFGGAERLDGLRKNGLSGRVQIEPWLRIRGSRPSRWCNFGGGPGSSSGGLGSDV